MRFSVDAHAIGCHLTGNEVYIRNLLNQFARLDRESEFFAYISKPGAELEIPSRFHRRQVSANPYKRLAFDLPLRLRSDRPNLLHVQYTGPVSCPAPLVVSVHDVSFLEHPQWFTRFRATQLKYTVKRTVQSAASVLTPSEFSRRAILRHYPIDDGPFVLTVGDLQPRKNHLGLLRAFEDVIRSHPHLPHSLVFVGKETWYSKELHRAVNRSAIAGRVHFTGFVEDADLVQFYAACDLFVFPSFYEGFGLPILEAMACGRAVACSNATAMPEVADAAAILFDPSSNAEMTRAISDVLLDPALRARLERLGAHRATLFSWEQAAKRTLDVYYEVAGAGRSAHVTPSLKARVIS